VEGTRTGINRCIPETVFSYTKEQQ